LEQMMLLLFVFALQLRAVDPSGLWGAERVFGP
jgi:hypothetical protein